MKPWEMEVQDGKNLIELLKENEVRKKVLVDYIMVLSSIPETCGRYMHEMNDAVSELHELMGFRKHNKG